MPVAHCPVNPWLAVADNDVFPAELATFLDLTPGPRTKSSAGFRLQTPDYRKTRGCDVLKRGVRSPVPATLPGPWA